MLKQLTKTVKTRLWDSRIITWRVFISCSGWVICLLSVCFFVSYHRDPPFAITHISPEPLIHESFINETFGGWAYKAVDYVIFPMGYTFDDRFIYVSYGRNDKDSWIAKFDRIELLASLKPVTADVLGTSEFDSDTGTIHRNTYKLTEKGYAAEADTAAGSAASQEGKDNGGTNARGKVKSKVPL